MSDKLRLLRPGWLAPLVVASALLGLSVGSLGTLGSAAAQQVSGAPAQSPPDATALLQDRNGRTLANVEFRQRSRDVLVRLTLADSPRPTGSHALQVHAAASCTTPDFASAGALLNANSKLPNINYSVGLTTYQATLVGASLLRGGTNSLVGGYGPTSSSGTSIVLFDKPDNGKAQADSALGDRIGCGVIRASQPGASGTPTATTRPLQGGALLAAAQPVPGAAQATATRTASPSGTVVRTVTATPTRTSLVSPTRSTLLTPTTQNTPGATAELRDRNGRTLANAEFRQFDREVLVRLTFANPPRLTGAHALQIHAAATCDQPDFTSAGPIFNPTNKPHGMNTPGGNAVGDLPNVNYTTGLTTYQASVRGASLQRGVPNSLIGNYGPTGSGTSIVLFDKADDGKTQPEGNAGERIACGVIRLGQPAAVGATPGGTPTLAGTRTLAGTLTPTPVATGTRTVTPTATGTRTVTPAASATGTPTGTRTPSAAAAVGTPTATPLPANAQVVRPPQVVSRPAAQNVPLPSQPTNTPTPRPPTPTRAAGTLTVTATPTRTVAAGVAGAAGSVTATPTRVVPTGLSGVTANVTVTPTATRAAGTAGRATATATVTPTRVPSTPTRAAVGNAQANPAGAPANPVGQTNPAAPAFAQVASTPVPTPTPPRTIAAANAAVPVVAAANAAPQVIAGAPANGAGQTVAGAPANGAGQTVASVANSAPPAIAVPTAAVAGRQPLAAPAAVQAPARSGGEQTPLMIAVLGVILVGAGYAVPRILRRRSD